MSVSRVLFLIEVSAINLGCDITAVLSCFLPSGSREQRSNAGLLGIATRSVAVSSVSLPPIVAVPWTKHCCLPAVNRYDALCCPDFPRFMLCMIVRQTDILSHCKDTFFL